MKRCPECRRDYYDDSLLYCLDDGNALLEGPASVEPPAHARDIVGSESPTKLQIELQTRKPEETAVLRADRGSDVPKPRGFDKRLLAALLLLAVIVVGGFLAYRYVGAGNSKQIESIAVMPFVNESGNAEIEYLSDGMTDSLIYNLSQVPNLSVKARSSVFRYKGTDAEPQKVGAELSVQAVLIGRVIQLGDQLTLSLGLVDARTGNQVWGEQYIRKRGDLISLQAEIARDVSNKLRAKLSSSDEKKVARNYTSSTEAYELYLKGRFHALTMRPTELETSIEYFKQAIEIDPSYASAYVGLADAYRAQARSSGERAPTEYLPKAKIAAKKAVEIDDSLADAHGSLGFILFWADRDWPAAEKECKRAIELDPNIADAHVGYAHFLLITGRQAEALAEVKRARELEPLNLRINSLEAQFLIYARQPDEALARLQKAFEVDPNFWFAHLFAASAYIDKGMYVEAADEARKAKELSGSSTFPAAQLGYALAMSGKRAEAQAVLEEVLKLSAKRYVPPYHVALLYAGLGQREEAIAWLQRGVQQHEPLLVFLKVEPKWDGLKTDPRFAELLPKIGLPQ